MVSDNKLHSLFERYYEIVETEKKNGIINVSLKVILCFWFKEIVSQAINEETARFKDMESIFTQIADYLGVDNGNVPGLLEAIEELKEETRWFYPEKGELPKILADYIIFYRRGRLSKPKIGMAYKDKDGNFMFFCNDTKQGYSQHEVKAWAYAPVLDEEPLPRSERLEKLTAERDALLEEDL